MAMCLLPEAHLFLELPVHPMRLAFFPMTVSWLTYIQMPSKRDERDDSDSSDTASRNLARRFLKRYARCPSPYPGLNKVLSVSSVHSQSSIEPLCSLPMMHPQS